MSDDEVVVVASYIVEPDVYEVVTLGDSDDDEDVICVADSRNNDTSDGDLIYLGAVNNKDKTKKNLTKEDMANIHEAKLSDVSELLTEDKLSESPQQESDNDLSEHEITTFIKSQGKEDTDEDNDAGIDPYEDCDGVKSNESSQGVESSKSLLMSCKGSPTSSRYESSETLPVDSPDGMSGDLPTVKAEVDTTVKDLLPDAGPFTVSSSAVKFEIEPPNCDTVHCDIAPVVSPQSESSQDTIPIPNEMTGSVEMLDMSPGKVEIKMDDETTMDIEESESPSQENVASRMVEPSDDDTVPFPINIVELYEKTRTGDDEDDFIKVENQIIEWSSGSVSVPAGNMTSSTKTTNTEKGKSSLPSDENMSSISPVKMNEQSDDDTLPFPIEMVDSYEKTVPEDVSVETENQVEGSCGSVSVVTLSNETHSEMADPLQKESLIDCNKTPLDDPISEKTSVGDESVEDKEKNHIITESPVVSPSSCSVSTASSDSEWSTEMTDSSQKSVDSNENSNEESPLSPSTDKIVLKRQDTDSRSRRPAAIQAKKKLKSMISNNNGLAGSSGNDLLEVITVGNSSAKGIIDDEYIFKYCYVKRTPVKKNRSGSSTPSYKCLECSYTSDTLYYLMVHVRKNHIVEKQMHCPECRNCVSFSQSFLLDHIKKYHPMNSIAVFCTWCNFVTIDKKLLYKHVKKVHSDFPLLYNCYLCQTCFDSEKSLKEHVYYTHNCHSSNPETTATSSEVNKKRQIDENQSRDRIASAKKTAKTTKSKSTDHLKNSNITLSNLLEECSKNDLLISNSPSAISTTSTPSNNQMESANGPEFSKLENQTSHVLPPQNYNKSLLNEKLTKLVLLLKNLKSSGQLGNRLNVENLKIMLRDIMAGMDSRMQSNLITLIKQRFIKFQNQHIAVQNQKTLFKKSNHDNKCTGSSDSGKQSMGDLIEMTVRQMLPAVPNQQDSSGSNIPNQQDSSGSNIPNQQNSSGSNIPHQKAPGFVTAANKQISTHNIVTNALQKPPPAYNLVMAQNTPSSDRIITTPYQQTSSTNKIITAPYHKPPPPYSMVTCPNQQNSLNRKLVSDSNRQTTSVGMKNSKASGDILELMINNRLSELMNPSAHRTVNQQTSSTHKIVLTANPQTFVSHPIVSIPAATNQQTYFSHQIVSAPIQQNSLSISAANQQTSLTRQIVSTPIQQNSLSNQIVSAANQQASLTRQIAAAPIQQNSLSHQIVSAPNQQTSLTRQIVLAPIQQNSLSNQIVSAANQQASLPRQIVVAPIQRNTLSNQIVSAANQQNSLSHQIVSAANQQTSLTRQIVSAPIQQNTLSHQIVSAANQQASLTRQIVVAPIQQNSLSNQIVSAANQQTSFIQQIVSAPNQQTSLTNQIVSAPIHQNSSTHQIVLSANQQTSLSCRIVSAANQQASLSRPIQQNSSTHPIVSAANQQTSLTRQIVSAPIQQTSSNHQIILAPMQQTSSTHLIGSIANQQTSLSHQIVSATNQQTSLSHQMVSAENQQTSLTHQMFSATNQQTYSLRRIVSDPNEQNPSIFKYVVVPNQTISPGNGSVPVPGANVPSSSHKQPTSSNRNSLNSQISTASPLNRPNSYWSNRGGVNQTLSHQSNSSTLSVGQSNTSQSNRTGYISQVLAYIPTQNSSVQSNQTKPVPARRAT